MISLRHPIFTRVNGRREYFTDGSVLIQNGAVRDIPRLSWAKRLWRLGYNIDADTNKRVRLSDVISAYSSKRAVDEEQEESPDAGGQPVSTDGIRESEPTGSENVLRERVASRRNNRSRRVSATG